jgi:hypothetical protein
MAMVKAAGRSIAGEADYFFCSGPDGRDSLERRRFPIFR